MLPLPAFKVFRRLCSANSLGTRCQAGMIHFIPCSSYGCRSCWSKMMIFPASVPWKHAKICQGKWDETETTFFPPIKSMAQQISWSRQADAWGHHGLIGSVSCGQAVSKPPYNECLLKRFSGHSGRPKMMTGWWFQTTQWIHMTILTLRYARARWCEHVLKHYRLSQTSDDDPN